MTQIRHQGLVEIVMGDIVKKYVKNNWSEASSKNIFEYFGVPGKRADL